MQGALPTLINLNLLLQRSDTIIHIIHDQLFSTTCVLLSRFVTPDTVKRSKQGETIAEITELVQDPDKLLAKDKFFLSYLARSQIKKLLSEGDNSQFEYDNFFDACQAFHKEAFLYAVKWFPLNDEIFNIF